MFFPGKGVNFTLQQYIDHEARIAKGKVKPSSGNAPAERETGKDGLHAQIIDHCENQWPRWKYRHARTDKKTTEEEGVEDFTIFMPNNQTIHVECKARKEKPSAKQLIWAAELRALGHTVYFVWSFDDFLSILRDLNLADVGSKQPKI